LPYLTLSALDLNPFYASCLSHEDSLLNPYLKRLWWISRLEHRNWRKLCALSAWLLIFGRASAWLRIKICSWR
jgi:hypothetical protein